MRKEALTAVLFAYEEIAPLGEEDYGPHAEKFLESYTEELKEGNITLTLLCELVRRSFTPRQAIGRSKKKIADLARLLWLGRGFNNSTLRNKLL